MDIVDAVEILKGSGGYGMLVVSLWYIFKKDKVIKAQDADLKEKDEEIKNLNMAKDAQQLEQHKEYVAVLREVVAVCADVDNSNKIVTRAIERCDLRMKL
ncbi:MAG: hypothetical protein KAS32_24515 [Candidatus Peribacteraceae bacterium]|nr:hypothetical protein [Candidatus Peribacteraceae bacterium]